MSAKPLGLILSCLLSLCMATSLAHANETTYYNKDGIRFELPAGWFISEDDETDGARFIAVENDAEGLFIIHSLRKQQFDQRPISLADYANWNATSQQEEITGAQRDLGSFKDITRVIAGNSYAGIRNEYSIGVLHVSLPHRSDYFLLHGKQRVAFASSQVPIPNADEVAEDFALMLGSIQLD